MRWELGWTGRSCRPARRDGDRLGAFLSQGKIECARQEIITSKIGNRYNSAVIQLYQFEEIFLCSLMKFSNRFPKYDLSTYYSRLSSSSTFIFAGYFFGVAAFT